MRSIPIIMKNLSSSVYYIVTILLVGFLIGTGIIGFDQLDLNSITFGHPIRVLSFYLLGFIIAIGLFSLETKNKK